MARGRFAGIAAVSGVRTGREDAGSFDDLAHQTADRCGYAPEGFLLGIGIAGGPGTGEGQDSGDRCDDAGSERGDALDRAAGQRGELRRVSERSGKGIGNPDAHAGRFGAAGPQAEEEGRE
jgi:hypothetical protein